MRNICSLGTQTGAEVLREADFCAGIGSGKPKEFALPEEAEGKAALLDTESVAMSDIHEFVFSWEVDAEEVVEEEEPPVKTSASKEFVLKDNFGSEGGSAGMEKAEEDSEGTEKRDIPSGDSEKRLTDCWSIFLSRSSFSSNTLSPNNGRSSFLNSDPPKGSM